MPEEYKRITKILVWLVALSMVAYFVITPFTYFRQVPSKTSPTSEEVTPTVTTTEQSSVQPQSDLPMSVPENLLPTQENTQELGTSTQ